MTSLVSTAQDWLALFGGAMIFAVLNVSSTIAHNNGHVILDGFIAAIVFLLYLISVILIIGPYTRLFIIEMAQGYLSTVALITIIMMIFVVGK